jgi:hypothetical protein
MLGTHCEQQKYQKLRQPSPLFLKDKMMVSLDEPALHWYLHKMKLLEHIKVDEDIGIA